MILTEVLQDKRFVVLTTGLSVHLRKEFPQLSEDMRSTIAMISALLIQEDPQVDMNVYLSNLTQSVLTYNQIYREALPSNLFLYIVANVKSMYTISYSDYGDDENEE